jgi:hypothetical protein
MLTNNPVDWAGCTDRKNAVGCPWKWAIEQLASFHNFVLAVFLNCFCSAKLCFLSFSMCLTALFACQNFTSPSRADKSFAFYSTSLSWTAAREVCLQNGGDLATIVGRVENDAVRSVASSGSYWIGLSDQVSEGNFVWASGSPSASKRYVCCPGGLNSY